MSYQHALKLFLASTAAVLTVAGCAEIPPDVNGGNGGGELSTVTVEVTGGAADIFPGREFSVPVGGDTLLFVDVSHEANTRIAGIWVDGGRQCCAEDGVVRDTGIALIGVRGGLVVVVELAKIDTVPPTVEIVSPAPAPGEIAAGVSVCSFGTLEYKLNKTMAKGYIKWWNAGESGLDDRDSLQVIRIPADITRYAHDIEGWSYGSPDEYLSKGLHKFDLTVSPVPGKRLSSRDQIAAPAAYTFEVQFTDSLGNSSGTISRVVWATAVAKGCQ
jgi:hypothetical protein